MTPKTASDPALYCFRWLVRLAFASALLLVLAAPGGGVAQNGARARALYVVDCPPFFTHRGTLLKLAAKAKLAVISGERPYADEGGFLILGL